MGKPHSCSQEGPSHCSPGHLGLLRHWKWGQCSSAGWGCGNSSLGHQDLTQWATALSWAYKYLRDSMSGFLCHYVSRRPEGCEGGLHMRGLLLHFQAGQCIREVARLALTSKEH